MVFQWGKNRSQFGVRGRKPKKKAMIYPWLVGGGGPNGKSQKATTKNGGKSLGCGQWELLWG